MSTTALDTNENLPPKKKTLKRLLIILVILIVIVGGLLWFFVIGWKAKSDNIKITYSNGQDNGDKMIYLDFKLKTGNTLKIVTDDININESEIVLKECLTNPFDDAGDSFQYGFNYTDENGKKIKRNDKHCIVIKLKDKTITLYTKDLIEEYGEK